MAQDLSGKVVVITGASSGIGRGTALAVATEAAMAKLTDTALKHSAFVSVTQGGLYSPTPKGTEVSGGFREKQNACVVMNV